MLKEKNPHCTFVALDLASNILESFTNTIMDRRKSFQIILSQSLLDFFDFESVNVFLQRFFVFFEVQVVLFRVSVKNLLEFSERISLFHFFNDLFTLLESDQLKNQIRKFYLNELFNVLFGNFFSVFRCSAEMLNRSLVLA